MKGRQTWRTHFPLFVLIAIIVVLGIGVLIVDPTSRTGRWIVVLWGIIPASVAIWQYCYTHIERHRLWVNRVRLWLSNPQVSWGLEVEYETVDAMRSFQAAQAAMRAQMGDQDDILSSSDDLFVAQFNGMAVRLGIDLFESPMDDATQIVRLDFPLAQYSWRWCRRLVDSAVPRLLEEVERAIQSAGSKFVIDIGFADRNPYFGLLVRDVPEASLVRFDIEYFQRPDRSGAVIRVHRDRIRVVATSIHSSRTLALHYLSLQPVGGT
jgi:hypothetical protein